MNKKWCLLVLLVIIAFASDALYAQRVLPSNLRVCSAPPSVLADEQQNAELCRSVESISQIDPQGKHLWLLADLYVPDERLASPKPIGLFLSGKASSSIAINDVNLASNGRPAASAVDEIAGVMDYVVFVPKAELRVGVNQLLLEMSSHQGWLHLSSPMHFAVLADYEQPENQLLRHYWATLLPFGVILIGAFYMGLLVQARGQLWPESLLPIMSLVAALQLIIEVSRGLWAYPYWFHDIRLVGILTCSGVFGLCIFIYTVEKLKMADRPIWFILIALALLITGVIALSGFDSKTTYVLMLPTLASLVFSMFYWRTPVKAPLAKKLALIYGVFALVMFLSLADFLDVTFYYLIASLLVVLFLAEIDTYRRERQALLEERTRADKLQTIVQQIEERDDNEFISVSGAGMVKQVPVSTILFCQGAGDYVELVLDDKGSELHSQRLQDLEKTLPTNFLRVHRSYIVNTLKIKSLHRKSSGVGELELSGGELVPVSRRIMPKVRRQLSS